MLQRARGICRSCERRHESVWPRMTCLFGVDVNRKKVEYIPQPSICAAMVSNGVRMWSVDEFMKEVDCDV